MGAAGVNPHIEGVFTLPEVGGQAQLLAKLLTGELEPDVGAVLGHQVSYLVHDVGTQHGLVVLIEEDGQRHAPGALARDAPVRAGFHGAVDAVAAPGGHPFCFVNLLQSHAAQLFHADEELLDGAEDDGGLGTPAVRVLVGEFFAAQQPVAFHQQGDDVLVALEYMLADQVGQAAFGGVVAIVIYRGEHGQPVGHAGDVVVCTVAGGNVHRAGTGISGHVGGIDDEGFAVEEGVAGAAFLQLAALEGGQFFLQNPAGLGGHGFDQFAHDDELALGAVLGVAADDVGEIRVQGDGQVAGQGPGSGGPDDHLAAFDAADGAIHFKAHVDGGGGVFHVFHLSFGQGGVVGVAPLHRFHGLVHGPAFHQLGEDAQNICLVLRLHGDVRVEPVAEHAQPAEGNTLQVNVVERKFGAAAADFSGFKPLEFLDHLGFDRQAVAVPAGDKGGVVARHGLALHDKVLEHLVQSSAHVHIAIGEGRAVVQHETGGILRLTARCNSLIELLILPFLQTCRLLGSEITTHGERGVRQEDGVFVALGVCGHTRATIRPCAQKVNPISAFSPEMAHVSQRLWENSPKRYKGIVFCEKIRSRVSPPHHRQ